MKHIVKKSAVAILLVGILFGDGFAFLPTQNAFALDAQRASVSADSGGSSGGGSSTSRSGSSSGGSRAIDMPQNQAVFNNHALDRKTLQTSNFTRDPYSTNWGDTAPVKNGELVSFDVYYHNNSTVTANNTKIALSFTNHYPSQQVQVTAKLWADNAVAVYGNTNLLVEQNPTQPWSLEFQYVKWYPNQDPVTPDPLPNGQNGSTITSTNGVNIGAITGGWASQGDLVAVFKFVVAPTGQAPTVETRDATNVSNTSASLNGYVNPNGSATTYWFEYSKTQGSFNMLTPQQSITSAQAIQENVTGLDANTVYYFRLVGQNQIGRTVGETKTFRTVQEPPVGGSPIIQTKDATELSYTSAVLNGNVNPNGYSTTYWFEYSKTEGSFNMLTPQNTIATTQNVQASLSSLDPDTTYYFRLVGQNQIGRTVGETKTFKTNIQPPTGGSPIVRTDAATRVTSSSASLNGYVNPNSYSTSYWFEYGTRPNMLTAMTPDETIGTTAQDVHATITGLMPNTTYYFRVAAQNSKGKSYGTVLSFVTNSIGGGTGSAPSVVTEEASQITNTTARLRGRVNPNELVTTYTFHYGTSATLVTYSELPELAIPSDTDKYVAVSADIANLSANTTYYFRVVASNAKGTTLGNILSFTTTGGSTGGGGGGGGGGPRAPIVTTDNVSAITETSALLYGSVHPNLSNSVGWFEYGTDQNTLSNKTIEKAIPAGSDFISFSLEAGNLKAGTKYYFRAVGRNAVGTSYGQVKEFSTLGQGTGQLMPTVQTLIATYIAQNSALLNATVNPNGNAPTTGWFEYGTTAALGLRTFTQPVGSGNKLSQFSHAITGLRPNTVYFYRAVAQNTYGISRGLIYVVRTRPVISGGGGSVSSTPPPVVITDTFGTGVACVLVLPTLQNNQLDAGADISYSVLYKNTCSFDITNAYLKVILPTEISYTSSNYPTSERNENEITFSLGTIPQGTESTITINGKVSNSVDKGDVLIFSSVLNFEDGLRRPQSISAYLTGDVVSERTLTATVLDAFRSLFGSWWFSLLLLLVVLFLIFWIFFRRRDDESEEAEVDVLRT